MADPEKPFEREDLESLFTKLFECGWIDESGFHDRISAYGFKWTPKGLERSKWVKEIESELNLGPRGMCALMAVCHMHADGEASN